MNNQTIKLHVPVGSRSALLMLRGVLAILLTIGFYGLALAIAGVLLFTVYAEVAYLERINLRVTLLCLAGAGTILWAIFPRIDRFNAPGARLQPQDQPRLFELIQQISTQTGQKMPAEVYLVPDVNAFVTERGGFMGIGRKRVMGIGLPLLQTLSTNQLAAILAHEFGHFYGGDTAVGPWIYKTREAIIRTVSSLQSKSLLQAPFRWYGELFLRVTQAISRRQELVADALAASVAGPKAVIESLKAVHGLAPAFASYWEREVIPLFNRGYRPPIGLGFERFTQNNRISEAINNIVTEELQSGKSNPFDSHPSLPERIHAMEAYPTQASMPFAKPASALLDNAGKMEQEMLLALYGGRAGELKPVPWEEVAETVYLKTWQEMVQQYAPGLSELTLANVHAQRAVNGGLSKSIQQSRQPNPGGEVSLEQQQSAVDMIITFAVGAMLARHGWRITTQPGCNFTLVKDGREIPLFETFQKLAAGELDADQWVEFWQSRGVDLEQRVLEG